MNKQDEEKAISYELSNDLEENFHGELREAFLSGCEWKEQHMIEKMINWLALHAELYGSFNGGKLNEMVIAMKKEMEEN